MVHDRLRVFVALALHVCRFQRPSSALIQFPQFGRPNTAHARIARASMTVPALVHSRPP